VFLPRAKTPEGGGGGGGAPPPPLAERLRQSADGVLEQIAREYGVSTFAVVEALPAEHRTIVPGARFEEVMQALTG
jgi:putative heme iron utilization protein